MKGNGQVLFSCQRGLGGEKGNENGEELESIHSICYPYLSAITFLLMAEKHQVANRFGLQCPNPPRKQNKGPFPTTTRRYIAQTHRLYCTLPSVMPKSKSLRLPQASIHFAPFAKDKNMQRIFERRETRVKAQHDSKKFED